tara:strand:+ start:3085 stop:4905 length:1821 start_codon:yes stop_codon:yes gene_type:complete
MAIKADATLVAAGHRLGQSYISNDHSAIFNKQFEGLREAYRQHGRGFAGAIKEGVKGSMELGGKLIGKEIEKERAIWSDINKGLKDLSSDLAIKTAQKEHEADKSNKPESAAIEGVDVNSFEKIRDELKDLESKKFLGSKGKKRRAELRGEIASLTENRTNERAAKNISTTYYGTNQANLDLSFNVIGENGTLDDVEKVEYQTLYAQVIDRKNDLASMGITPKRGSFVNGEFVEKPGGDLYIEASRNRLLQEYLKNQPGGQEVVDALKDQQKLTTEPGGELTGRTIMVKYTDLMNSVVPYDRASEANLNEIVTGTTKLAEELVTQVGQKTKGLLYTNYSEIEGTVKRQIHDALSSAEANVIDLASRDVQVGGQNRNFGADFKKSPKVSALRYSSLGLTGAYTKKQTEDGVLSSDELTDDDKDIVIQRYLKPQNTEERNALINDMTEWYNGHAKTAFDNHRKKMGVGVTGEEVNVIKTRDLTREEEKSRAQRLNIEDAIQSGFDRNKLSDIKLINNRTFKMKDNGNIVVVEANGEIVDEVMPGNHKGILRMIKDNAKFLLPTDMDALEIKGGYDWGTDPTGEEGNLKSQTTMMANFPSTTGGSIDDF